MNWRKMYLPNHIWQGSFVLIEGSCYVRTITGFFSDKKDQLVLKVRNVCFHDHLLNMNTRVIINFLSIQD